MSRMEIYLLLVPLLASLSGLCESFEIPKSDRGLTESKMWPNQKGVFPYPVQSPVDIPLSKVEYRELPPLEIHFPWRTAGETVSIENTGYYLEVLLPHEIEERPYLTGGPLFNGKYIFEQMHFHWSQDDKCGSENHVDGKCYSCEVHVVYYNDMYGSFKNASESTHADGVAVLTFFGDLSLGNMDNPDLIHLIRQFDKVVEPESKTNGAFYREFRFLRVLFKQKTYYTFPGSLTTPSFSQCVTWIVCTEPFDISSRQLNKFRELRGKDGRNLWNNDRPLQEFNGRPLVSPSNKPEITFSQDFSQ